MLIARDIYERFQVPPWLQTHQVRVAAVGKILVSHTPGVDKHLVVSTCLLHDIGAIVKFDFSFRTHTALKALYPADEIPHWSAVQQEIRQRYGEREHAASDAILRELGFEDVRKVFSVLGLAKVPFILEHDLLEAQIVEYADMRSGPFGVIPIEERLAEGERRYAEYVRREGKEEEAKQYPLFGAMLEKRIFEHLDLRPEDITEEAAAPLMKELWDYEIA